MTGRTAANWPARKGLQAVISSGAGFRFFGGRHLTMLQM